MKRFLLPLSLLLIGGLIPSFADSAAPSKRDDSAAEKLGWHLASKGYTFRAITLFEAIEISHRLGLKFYEMNPTQKMSPEHPVNTDATLPPELRAEVKKKFAEAGIQPVNDEKKDVVWGTGKTDVKGMLEELHRQKFQGIFSMEYESSTGDALVDELTRSIECFDHGARRIAEGK
jgi:sugar phosphate isomerase/epimerase